jgi:hypothetical protein
MGEILDHGVVIQRCRQCGQEYVDHPMVEGRCEGCHPWGHLQLWELHGRTLRVRLQILDINNGLIGTWESKAPRLRFAPGVVTVAVPRLVIKNTTGDSWCSSKQVIKVEGLPITLFGAETQCFDTSESLLIRPGDELRWVWADGMIGAVLRDD